MEQSHPPARPLQDRPTSLPSSLEAFRATALTRFDGYLRLALGLEQAVHGRDGRNIRMHR
jgi:hypothetical protein